MTAKTQLDVSFQPVTVDNLFQLKALHTAVIPVRYSEKFYREVAAFHDITQLAVYDGEVIGAVTARLERVGPAAARMYIMTLAVLAPYRSMGVGSALLTRSLAAAAEDPAILEAYLHVHASNQAAIDFYRRFGFQLGEIVPQYYRQLDPPDAVVLSRSLNGPPSDVTTQQVLSGRKSNQR